MTVDYFPDALSCLVPRSIWSPPSRRYWSLMPRSRDCDYNRARRRDEDARRGMASTERIGGSDWFISKAKYAKRRQTIQEKYCRSMQISTSSCPSVSNRRVWPMEEPLLRSFPKKWSPMESRTSSSRCSDMQKVGLLKPFNWPSKMSSNLPVQPFPASLLLPINRLLPQRLAIVVGFPMKAFSIDLSLPYRRLDRPNSGTTSSLHHTGSRGEPVVSVRDNRMRGYYRKILHTIK